VPLDVCTRVFRGQEPRELGEGYLALTSATPRLVEVVAIDPSGISSDGGEAVHEVRTRRRLDLVSEMHLGGKRGRRVLVTPT